MKVKILVGAVITVAIGVVGYLMLGGADEVIVMHGKVDDYVIVGMDYQGRYRSQELRDLYEDIKDKMESDMIEGVMVVVNYDIDKDSLENGFIHQFLGIQLDMVDNYDIPEGFTSKVIETNAAIKAQITAHNLVMPSPEDVEEKIVEYAQIYQLKTVDYSIEKYITDRELVVEVPIIE